MSRKQVVIVLAAIVIAAVLAGLVVIAASRSKDSVPCGAGFTRHGARCCPVAGSAQPQPPPQPPPQSNNTCAIGVVDACPPPLVVGPRGCDTSDDVGKQRVHVGDSTLTIGPSDWEAEGRVAARHVKTPAFFIDRFEVTVGRFCELTDSTTRSRWRFCEKSDSARAAFGIPLGAARTYCSRRGGRLPTEDEWLVAAAGGRP